MIKLQNISLKNGDFELKNINIEVKKASIHAILGPSGAGKSTILNVILGLQKIDQGKIIYNNKDITDLEVHKRGFGYVPQKLALFPHLSVEDNIKYGLKAANKKSTLFQDIVKTTNISNFLNRYPNSLSGGEKQRVALARAFVIKPDLLLLDEPFNALDIQLKKEIWQLLKTHSAKFKTTVIIVTHDLNEAYYLADTLTIVVDGKVAQSGSKSDIFDNPANIKVAKYLGINNIYVATAIDSNKINIKNSSINLITKQKLVKNRLYNLLIKNRDIGFVDEKAINSIKGEYKVMELEYYDIVTFTIINTNISIEFISSKNCKKTNYIQISPKNIICYEK